VKMPTIFKWSRLRAFLTLAAATLAAADKHAGCADAVAPPERMHVLCLASKDCRSQGLDGIDPKAIEGYRDLGVQRPFDFYQRLDAARLEQFPVVVGMMPMLFPGTRANRTANNRLAVTRKPAPQSSYRPMPASGIFRRGCSPGRNGYSRKLTRYFSVSSRAKVPSSVSEPVLLSTSVSAMPMKMPSHPNFFACKKVHSRRSGEGRTSISAIARAPVSRICRMSSGICQSSAATCT